jgi:hypothetical protein
VPAKVTKLIGLKRPPFLSPTNLIIFACTQNGEFKKLYFLTKFPSESNFKKLIVSTIFQHHQHFPQASKTPIKFTIIPLNRSNFSRSN